MYHGMKQRKLGRKSTHRMAMFSNMSTSLIENERIQTTLPKAKELRRIVEKLITKGKKGDLHNRRQVYNFLRSDASVTKLFGDIAPRFKDRKGGYTRILKLADTRNGDAASMAVIEFVDYVMPIEKSKEQKKTDRADEKKKAKEAAAAKPKGVKSAKESKPKLGKTSKAGGSSSMKSSGSRGS